MYGMSINELLSGKKLSTEEYKEMAETNIKATLKASAFSLKEKQEFYKKKWLKGAVALTCGSSSQKKHNNTKRRATKSPAFVV